MKKGKIEARLKELDIVLPTPPAPVASYVPYVETGKLVFVSGQVPALPEGGFHHPGKVGQTVTLQQGVEAARTCAINVIAQIKAAAGDLDRVARCVKVTVFVNAEPNFTQHPEVANGASDLFVEVFGEAGRHARAAVGASSLPRNAAVEVEAVFELA
jgi:enamine deaminase RidA (YjgF/YER057c/UK114 family)